MEMERANHANPPVNERPERQSPLNRAVEYCLSPVHGAFVLSPLL